MTVVGEDLIAETEMEFAKFGEEYAIAMVRIPTFFLGGGVTVG